MSSDPGYADYYTVSEFAERIGMSEKTVRTYIQTGRINAQRLGPRRIAIPIDEVDNVYRPYQPSTRRPLNGSAS
jgi:excisionase family DNA binding protein